MSPRASSRSTGAGSCRKGVEVSPILNHDDSRSGVSREMYEGVFAGRSTSRTRRDPPGVRLLDANFHQRGRLPPAEDVADRGRREGEACRACVRSPAPRSPMSASSTSTTACSPRPRPGRRPRHRDRLARRLVDGVRPVPGRVPACRPRLRPLPQRRPGPCAPGTRQCRAGLGTGQPVRLLAALQAAAGAGRVGGTDPVHSALADGRLLTRAGTDRPGLYRRARPGRRPGAGRGLPQDSSSTCPIGDPAATYITACMTCTRPWRGRCGLEFDDRPEPVGRGGRARGLRQP